MSLINKMLQDLESRKDPQVDAVQKKPVYEDLKPISPVARPRAPSRRLTVLAALIGVTGAGAFAWTQWGDSLTSGLFPGEAAVKPTPVARRTPPPKPAPVAAPAPTPVASVEAAAGSAIPAPIPPASPATASDRTPETALKTAAADMAPVVESAPKTPTVAPAPAPKMAPPADAKAAVAETDFWTVSQGDTLYSISAKTGVDLWDLSRWNGLNRDHVIQPGQRLRLTPPAVAAKSENRQPAEAKQPKKAASAKTLDEQKPDTKKTAVTMTSAAEAQTGNAVMDKKLKPLTADEKAETEYRRALDSLQKGRMADAEKHLKAALSANETHTRARELLAGLMLQQGHWRETQKMLEQGIDKVPAYYPFAQLLARVYVEHGADQKALTVMEQSRRAAAGNPDYTAFLAALYQRAGKHADAVKTYNEAVALSPQEGRWWLGMGISLEAMQDWDTAAAAYQRAVDSGVLDDNLLKYARQRLTLVNNK